MTKKVVVDDKEVEEATIQMVSRDELQKFEEVDSRDKSLEEMEEQLAKEKS